MFLLIALALIVTFVVTIGTILRISLDRAASLADGSAVDLVLARTK